MSTDTLERAFVTARQVVANVRLDQLDDRSPCVSWTVRDLLNHMISGSHFFAASVNDGKSPPPDNRDYTGADMVATYDDGIKQAVTAFGAPGVQEKMIELPFGTLPGSMFMAIATTDVFTHAWDVAKATGQSTDLDPELAAELLEGSRAFIQPAFRGDDTKSPFGAEQQPPANATEADKLAAFLGRHC